MLEKQKKIQKSINKKICLIMFSIFFICSLNNVFANNSLNFFNEDVSVVLQTLARVNNINIIVDETVNGRITINLNNVSFDTALDLIARSQGLLYKNIDDVIVITSMGDQKQRTDAPRYLSGIYTFKLKYIGVHTASEVIAKMLSLNVPADAYKLDKDISNDYVNTGNTTNISNSTGSSGQSNSSLNSSSASNSFPSNVTGNNISPLSNDSASNSSSSRTISKDRLQIDRATNTLIFWGTATEADDIKKILNKIDVPSKQISIQAEFLAISKDASNELGINWSWKDIVYTRLASSKNADSDKVGYSLDMGVNAKVNALFKNSNTKILARPNISTGNGVPAYIEIGDEVPIAQLTRNNDGSTTNSVQGYRKTGIILRCIPRVNGDGTINANIYTEVSIPTIIPENGLYKISSRRAGTQMKLRDGETIAIGGLIHSNEVRGLSKVPFLGDLPFIGGLFRNELRSKDDLEVIILLTARVLPDNSNLAEE